MAITYEDFPDVRDYDNHDEYNKALQDWFDALPQVTQWELAHFLLYSPETEDF